MDTRYRFVEQLQKEGLVKVKFVPSAQNMADGNTKNVTGDILESHSKEYLAEKSEISQE